MDEVMFRYLMKWMALYGQWQTMFEDGAEPSKMTDGWRLNGIRNQLKWVIIRLEEDGYTFEQLIEEAHANHFDISGMEELPPKMPADYMKDKELVYENAKNALECYYTSQEYMYIEENIAYLSFREKKTIEKKIAFVKKLEQAIKYERYGEMKLYACTEKYLDEIKDAAALLHICMSACNPFIKIKKNNT